MDQPPCSKEEKRLCGQKVELVVVVGGGVLLVDTQEQWRNGLPAGGTGTSWWNGLTEGSWNSKTAACFRSVWGLPRQQV